MKWFNAKPKTDAPNTSELLFAHDPKPCVLFDEHLKVIDCNEEAVCYFGFGSKTELLSGIVPLILDGIPPYQPSGRESVPFHLRLARAAETGSEIFLTELVLRGKTVVFDAVMKRVPLGQSYAVAVYMYPKPDEGEHMRIAMDTVPVFCAVMDAERRRVTNCTMNTVRYFGFRSKDDFLHRQKECLPAMQADGRDSRRCFLTYLTEAREKGQSVFDFMLRSSSGAELQLEITINRENWHDDVFFVLYARDIQSLKSTEYDLKLHARQLQAVNEIASHLIASGPETFEAAVGEALRIIGMAVNADRAYVWENFDKDGEMYCRQLYEWSEHVEAQQGKDFTMFLPYTELPEWRKRAEERKSINGPVSAMRGTERKVLQMQGIQSVLMIPIYINNRFWGFIGFDDCHVERSFSRMKEQVLESAGILIVSSIERNRITQLAIDHERLLNAVNHVAHLLLGAEEGDFVRTVHDALKTLGEYVGAELVSVWQNTLDEQNILCSKRLVMYRSELPFDENRTQESVDFTAYFPDWYETRQDINKTAEAFTEAEKKSELLEGCRSMLLLPITIHGEFWGFISFLHKTKPYHYNDKQISILRSGGMLIASGVARHEITRNLVEAREHALASARSKSEFLSRMSHEIRTPMNAIIGMTTLARKSGDINKVRRYLETVDMSSQQLLGIINDVLDMSKIDANRLEIYKKEFNFDEMIRHAINVVQVKLIEKRLDLRLDMPRTFTRTVVSDELRLSQVLINLLSNAVKFTPECGVITLTVAETPIDPDHSALRIEVSDTGIGIQKDLIPHVFESFEQGDGSITRQYGGTGLGLAICKRIVHLMGGEINADSEVGKGSRFTVDMDIAWGKPLLRETEGRSLRAGMRILVVDDSPDVLEYFKSTLEQFSQQCETAESGEQAVMRVTDCVAGEVPYDIIFLDWFMPHMNGAQTAREIRRIMGSGVMVVLISSADWSEIEQDALSVGLTQYISKPVLPSDLYNKLVELTDAVETARPDPDAPAAVMDWHGQCILLAEDIEINREIMAGILEDTGLTIDFACDGREAVDLFAANPDRYKIILMDVQMPVIDGLNATRLIRASGLPRAQEIPIIAMTANAFKEDEQASLEAGMNGHIAKPVDVDVLMDILRKALI